MLQQRRTYRVIRWSLAALLVAGVFALRLPEGGADTALHPEAVERWRPLVEKYWGLQGYADEVEYALMVMHAESSGSPTAQHPGSRATGLFQHLPKYWAERSVAAGWAGADIWDPEANIAVAAWLRATSPRHGWQHWTPTHTLYPTGSWGPDTHWDASRGHYVNVGGGTLSTGGAFVQPGPRLGMEVTKTADPELVPFGLDVAWAYEVTNVGEGVLWALYLWDDTLGEVECPVENIGIGETVICAGVEPSEVGEHGDRVLAFAWGEDGSEVAASADGSYIGMPDAAVDLTVRIDGWDPQADRVTLAEGAPTVLLYEITNLGAEGLSGLFVWDDLHGAVTCPDLYLSPGETARCWLTATAFGGPVEGSITVEAWTDDGFEIEGESTIRYTGLPPEAGPQFLQ